MNGNNFRITGIRAGSAARIAEQAADETPTPSATRVRAGSSARMAEEAKRNLGEFPSTTAGFTLRGQGGRVVRQEEVTSFPHPNAGEYESNSVVKRKPDPTAAHRAADPHEHTSSPRGSVNPFPAAPLQSTAGRLQSMFRALFKPGEPSKD